VGVSCAFYELLPIAFLRGQYALLSASLEPINLAPGRLCRAGVASFFLFTPCGLPAFSSGCCDYPLGGQGVNRGVLSDSRRHLSYQLLAQLKRGQTSSISLSDFSSTYRACGEPFRAHRLCDPLPLAATWLGKILCSAKRKTTSFRQGSFCSELSVQGTTQKGWTSARDVGQQRPSNIKDNETRVSVSSCQRQRFFNLANEWSWAVLRWGGGSQAIGGSKS